MSVQRYRLEVHGVSVGGSLGRAVLVDDDNGIVIRYADHTRTVAIKDQKIAALVELVKTCKIY